MKVLKAVVKVVAIVATVLSFIPGPWQPVAAIVAKVAMVASAALEVAAPTKKAKPNARGSPTEFRLDPQAGIPYMVGRTQFAGNGVKRETWGQDNIYQCFTSVYSYGPIQSIEAFTADRVVMNTNGSGAVTNASITGFMWFVSQLGLCPSPLLASPVAGYPGWDATRKMSGLAASHWVLKFDKDGKKYTAGPPQPGLVAQGVKVYDPRLNSTVPGGSGACRAGNEATYVYSETPHLHALTYALGRYQNGKKRMGIGFPASSIDMAYFAQAATIDEANGWKVGGLVYSTDSKWNTLKWFMEAGGARPVPIGGILSGVQSCPRASIATISEADIIGRGTISGGTTFRDRINTGVPRYRSEAHGWEYVQGDPVAIAGYIATDGGGKTREYEWTLVQQVKQASQLTAYEMYNAREMGPIELPLKLRWIGLKPGDCVTLDMPTLNLVNQKAVSNNRSLDIQTGAVTHKFWSETDSKHTDALAVNGAAPPIASLAYDPDAAAVPPGASDWTVTSGLLSTSSGVMPSLRFTGSVGARENVTRIEFQYRKVGGTTWTSAGWYPPDTTRVDLTSVEPGSQYQGQVRYEQRFKISAFTAAVGPATVDAIGASSATIATSITGQGALATLNQVSIGPAGRVYRDDGSTRLTDALAVTSLGTAAGISGQGILATRDDVRLGIHTWDNAHSNLLGNSDLWTILGTSAGFTGQGALATRGWGRLGLHLRRADDTTVVGDADAITSLGTAAGFTGQGLLATRGWARFGLHIRRADDTTVVDDADAITSLGTAAGFTGQGALATRGWGRLGLHLRRSDDTTVVGDADAITSLGTAAGFLGQGYLATQNYLGRSRQLSWEAVDANDSDFDDESYWNVAAGITYTTTDALATNAVPGGMGVSKAAVVTASGANPQATSTMGFGVLASAEPGKRYRVTVRYAVKTGFKGYPQLTMRCYAADGTTILATGALATRLGTDYRTVAAAANAISDLSNEVVAPDGTAFIMFRLDVVWPTAAASAGVMLWGRPKLSLLTQTGAAGDLRLEDGVAGTDVLVRTPLGTAAGFSGQGVLATRSNVFLGVSGHVYRDDGTTRLTDALAVTSLGTAASITGQGALATKSTANLDTDVADGSTYGRVVMAHLSSGVPKLSVAGSGTLLGDSRNVPPVLAAALGYKFTGAITSSTTSTLSTVSVAAGNLIMGSTTIAYNAMSATFAGSSGQTKTLYCYVQTNSYVAGAHTLLLTVDPLVPYQNNNNVYIGVISVTYPASGSSGGGGIGGGGACVAEDVLVETDRGSVPAAEVREGDYGRVIRDDGDGMEWATVRSNKRSLGVEPMCQLMSLESGTTVRVSCPTPVTLRDGSVIKAAQVDGDRLPVVRNGQLRWEACVADPAPPQHVRYISFGGRSYLAGDKPNEGIVTHNQSKP